ncbi:MAG: hypothetical protein AAB906_01695 [Patescibacteria group bacterium]
MEIKKIKNQARRIKKKNSRVWLFFNPKKITAAITALFFVAYAKAICAANADQLLWGGREDEVRIITGLGSRDPLFIIAGLIRVILSFLGILALAIIMLAGFKWMVSGGNEEKSDEARRMLFSGIIGLIIILASFALASYLINNLADIIGIL